MSVPATPLLYLVPHLDLPADPNLAPHHLPADPNLAPQHLPADPNLPGPDLPADPNLLLFPTLPPSTSPQILNLPGPELILPPTASKFPLIPKMDPRQLRSNFSNKFCTNYQGEALIPISDVGKQNKKRDEKVINSMLVWNRYVLKEEPEEYFEEFKFKIVPLIL